MNRIGTIVVVGLLAAGSLYAAPALHPALESAKVISDPGVALTSEQMRIQADSMLSRMQTQVQTGRQAQSTAKVAKDSIKLSCINHSLILAEQLTTVGEDDVLALKRTANHEEQAAHYKRVAEVAVECDEAHKAIGDCLGTADVSMSGSTSTTVSIDGKLFMDNPINDCNALGRGGCVSQPLEYVAFASPFIPD